MENIRAGTHGDGKNLQIPTRADHTLLWSQAVAPRGCQGQEDAMQGKAHCTSRQ